MTNRRELLLSSLLFSALLFSNIGPPFLQHRMKPPRRGLNELIPMTLGEWSYQSSDGLILAADQAVDDKNDDLLIRVYTGASVPTIMLLIGYSSSQDEGYQLHRPESCYPASGFAISGRTPVRLRLEGGYLVEAQAMTAVSPLREEHILYWTRIGNEFPTTYVGQRFTTAKRTILGKNPDAVLVRISSIGSRSVLADVKRFAHLLLTATAAEVTDLLAGAPSPAEV